MEFIKISKEDLLTLLNLAFVEGYTSYLDLQESAVQTILDDYIKKNKLTRKVPGATVSSTEWITSSAKSDEEESWMELK